MAEQCIRVRLSGRLAAETASALGVSIEWANGDYELVADYIDHANLAGLLQRLDALHISYSSVAVEPER